MGKRNKKTAGSQNLLVALAAVVLFAGTFALASGAVIDTSNSMLASVIASLTGRPTIIISRDSTSRQGSILPGYSTQVAEFDIVAKNVTHWATLKHLSGQFVITTGLFSPLTISDVKMSYQYCIPAGKTYGYGWKGGNCGTVTVTPSSIVKTATGYALNIDTYIPIYPEASQSILYIDATPAYAYTGSATHANSADAKLQVKFATGIATGDQCRTIYYGLQNKYGYQGKCVSLPAGFSIASAGNVLTVSRPYGYGYLPSSRTATTLSVGTDASTPSYRIVAAGSSGVSLAVYSLHATGEAIKINHLNLFLSSGSSSSVNTVYIYSGANLIGTGHFAGAGGNIAVTLSSPVQIPKDSTLLLTAKAGLAVIGAGQPGVPGDLIKLEIASADGSGVSSGSNVSGSNYEGGGKVPSRIAGVRIFKSFPTVAKDSLPSSGVADGRLMRFKVVADPAGTIGVARVMFAISASSNMKASDFKLYAFSDAAYSTPVGGQNAGGQVGSTLQLSTPSSATTQLLGYTFNPIEVPAGNAVYFELRANATSTSAGASITTNLLGDNAFQSLTTVPLDAGNFIWSANDTGVSAASTADWTSGYGVQGLLKSGIVQTRVK